HKSPKKPEVTCLADASKVETFPAAHRWPEISIWAIQRDNGGCPGTIDSNHCSGIKQRRWAFSHLLDPFTKRYPGRSRRVALGLARLALGPRRRAGPEPKRHEGHQAAGCQQGKRNDVRGG